MRLVVVVGVVAMLAGCGEAVPDVTADAAKVDGGAPVGDVSSGRDADPDAGFSDVENCVPYLACIVNTDVESGTRDFGSECFAADNEIIKWAVCSTSFPCRDQFCRPCVINGGEYCNIDLQLEYGCIAEASRAGQPNAQIAHDVVTYYQAVCVEPDK